jgi:hypothetical protein
MAGIQEGAGFTQKDAENLERVKDAMAELAVGKEGMLGGGHNAAAAAAFAQLLDAETRRQELTVRAVGKASEAALPEVQPAAKSMDDTSWAQKLLNEEPKAGMSAASPS